MRLLSLVYLPLPVLLQLRWVTLFSKVGNVVVSDSDDDEVLEYLNKTNYFGSGGNERSLLEQ